MSGRPNWHYDHPPACSCAQCTSRRTRQLQRGGLIWRVRKFLRSLFAK